MVALCFSTSFVVMSPLIDMTTSRPNDTANRVPRKMVRGDAHHWTQAKVGKRNAQTRNIARRRGRPAADVASRFGRAARELGKNLQGHGCPLLVGPTRRILDPAVVQ